MHFPSLVSPPKNPIATGPGTIGDGAGPLGGGLLLDGTRTVVQGDGPVVGGANVCPIGPEVVSAAEAVRAEARRRYEGIPGDIMAKLAPFEAFTVVEALSQVVFGCVYIIKVQVVAPPSNQYAGARPAKSPTPENLLLRVWAKTDGKFVLEGMVKGRGADQLRYFEKNTFEGMVLRGRPG